MGVETAIAWTDSTFNPWWGCARIDPACEHCYAEALAKRYGHAVWGTTAGRRTFGDKHWNEPEKWNAAAIRAGVRHRVFCGSMCDWADKDAPAAEVPRLFALIRRTLGLDWLLLTKRHDRIAQTLPADWGEGYPNAWLGCTVGDKPGLRRAETLRHIPARVRFLSIEPLLEDLGDVSGHLDGIHWVIVGAESGAHARPMEEAWVRNIRDQCIAAGVGFFYKQQVTNGGSRKIETPVLDGRRWVDPPTGIAPRASDLARQAALPVVG